MPAATASTIQPISKPRYVTVQAATATTFHQTIIPAEEQVDSAPDAAIPSAAAWMYVRVATRLCQPGTTIITAATITTAGMAIRFGNHGGIRGNNNNGGQFQGGNRNVGGTINPWSRPQGNDGFCQLKRIPWQNENVNYDPISYSGNEIILNRANTDPNNNSITSKEQAVIVRDGDDWYLEDRSAQQTTLIRAGRPIKLEDGDIIVMGNRMFEFHK